MTDATETALEEICGGILFCIAVAMVVLLHHTYTVEVAKLQAPQQKIIVYEGEDGWKHLGE